jgi:multiple sugar transport system substrate-binding protein
VKEEGGMMSAKLTRREILRAGALLVGTTIAVSCAPRPSAPDEPVATPVPGEPVATPVPGEPVATPVPEEKVALRMAFWDAWALDAYEHEAKLFNELFPNVTVSIEMTSFGEYNAKLMAAMAGAVPPDVAGAINIFFTSLAAAGSLMPVDPFVERDEFPIGDWLEGNLKDGTWLGDLMAIPFTADALWWFYNLDEFQKAGLKTPTELWKEGKWNWDTYLDLAAKLTKGEGLDKQWGTENIVPQYDFKFYPMIWQNDGDLFDPQYTKCILDEEEAVQAFEFAHECRKFAPAPGEAEAGTPESGRLMMWGQWELYNQFYVGELPFEWGVAPPPGSPHTDVIMFCGDAPGWAIPTGVKHPDESWEWIKFLLTPPSLERLFRAIAAPPPRLSMLETPEVFVNHPKYPNPELCWEITQARMKAFKNTPKISNYAEMKTVMSDEMSLVWADTMVLREGIDKVTKGWTDLVKKAVIDPDVGCVGPFC